MRKFLWTFGPLFAPEDEAGALPIDPAPAPTDPAPAESPKAAPAEGEAPAKAGSLVPEGEAPAEAPAEPLKLEELTLPEGMKADDPALAKLAEVLADSKLKPAERAQALIDTYRGAAESVAKATGEALSKNYLDLNRRWVEEVAADPEVGGANQSKALASIAKAIDAYGDGKAVREALALTGAGNHPAVIRMLYKMASALGEGAPAQGQIPVPPKDAKDLFYPSAATPQN